MWWTAFKVVRSAYKFGKDHRDQVPNFSRKRNPELSSFNDNNQHNNPNMNNHNHSFPTVPSSLSTGAYGTRGDYAAQDAPGGVHRTAPHSLGDVRPYLGLRSRLSQVWINRWTILILLVLVRVLIALVGLRGDIDNAKDRAMSACNSVESIGSNMASMPHYLSEGVNQIAAHGVEKAVHALYTGLYDIVSAAEAIFLFWINMVYGMYECLITFAVTGALKGVLDFADDAVKFLNQTLGGIGNELGDALKDFNTALQGFENGFNDVASVFTGKAHPPAQLDLNKQINELKTLKIPATVTDDIQKLKDKIPTFDEVHNATNQILSLPFEEIKKLMNQTLPVFTFDKTLLPVPQRTQLAFCDGNDGITDFFESLYKVADMAKKIFCVILVIAAILACIPMGYMEIRRWRSQKTYASRIQAHAVDNIDGVYIASRPWTAWGGIELSKRFGSDRARILARWFVAYITSIPALVLLSLALAGLFSCLCQYAILKSVEKEVPALAQDVGDFANKVVYALNNASAEWANGANHVITNTNNDLNQHVFGWVNTSTTAVNDTLNAFVDKTVGALNDTFGGTVLYEPIMDVYKCLVLLKIQGIEKGLTWVHDHAYVSLPMFPNDTFSAGAQASLTTNKTTNDGQNNSFLADPTDGATDKITEVVTKLANKFADGIRTEALISTALLVLYLFIVIMGLARCMYSMLRGAGKSRAEGGASYAGDVGPGMAEDNSNQAAINRESHISGGFAHAVPMPGPLANRETPSVPPPLYEPPAKGTRFPQFQSGPSERYNQEEEAYQNEKMGFDRTGSSRGDQDCSHEQNDEKHGHGFI